jgi:N-acetyl-gamma-glutamylphosphate reductase
MTKIRAAIYGGSGYGGSELLRILLFHRNVEIAFVTANEQAGKAISEVHKNLLGLTDLQFVRAPEDPAELDAVDIVFLALPHGQAMDVIPRLPKHVKAVDISGDFRIDDPDVLSSFTSLSILRVTFRGSSSTAFQRQIGSRSALRNMLRIPAALPLRHSLHLLRW